MHTHHPHVRACASQEILNEFVYTAFSVECETATPGAAHAVKASLAPQLAAHDQRIKNEIAQRPEGEKHSVQYTANSMAAATFRADQRRARASARAKAAAEAAGQRR